MDPTSTLTASLLLSLPINIRKRIYVFAGLVRECPITITPPSRGVIRPVESNFHTCAYKLRKQMRPDRVTVDSPECDCPHIPKQLLLVCKAIHKEVLELLYSENKFIVRTHQHVEDLRVLLTLPSEGIRALRHLLIRLNSWPCIRGHSLTNMKKGECWVCDDGNISNSDPEVSVGNSASEDITAGWLDVCQRLAAIITPGKLHLEFICDVGDLATAEYIIRPLKSLPRLRECSIRLGRRVDYTLRSLAESTALGLTTEETEEKQTVSKFTFSSLPREIRLRILEFTNLGPGGSYLSDFSPIRFTAGKYNHEVGAWNMRSAVRTCCTKCSFTKLHCSCPLNYASYSKSCACRLLPLELFLVSQQMYVDAAEILFSSNTFLFSGTYVETMNALKSLPSDSLKQIRRIRLDMGGDYLVRHENENEWWTLLSFIRNNLETSKLCIELDFDMDGYQISENDMYSSDRQRQSKIAYSSYVIFMRAVREELSDLLDFHVELGIFFDLEPVLEKYVMGEDYDANIGNKYPRRNKAANYVLWKDEWRNKIPPWHKDLDSFEGDSNGPLLPGL
ncbi:unnamed protein product [Clonostachys rosea]|uniref:DUF7730 domain-containing protein n=1 Tax=Bionectria ochroleuca TaxID=29856 RepID=A0ABY6UQ97_BIOOC|nr:unnamed protein product [Clonostachys rosea]